LNRRILKGFIQTGKKSIHLFRQYSQFITTPTYKWFDLALYSYPYLNQQNPLSLPVIAYTLSTTKLEIRAK
jgi:hypothetical protein